MSERVHDLLAERGKLLHGLRTNPMAVKDHPAFWSVDAELESLRRDGCALEEVCRLNRHVRHDVLDCESERREVWELWHESLVPAAFTLPDYHMIGHDFNYTAGRSHRVKNNFTFVKIFVDTGIRYLIQWKP